MLKFSLILLQRNFLNRFSYPVIIFHEDFTEKEKAYLRNDVASLSFIKLSSFQDIYSNASISKNDIKSWVEGEDGGRKGASVGYRNMCRFYSYPMLIHEALADYDYYWRFDDDSFLIDKLEYDPFQKMAESNSIYGFNAKAFENPKNKNLFNLGFNELWQITRKFARKNRLSIKALRKHNVIKTCSGYTGIYFYNNFEINNIRFWRHHDLMKAYFFELDRTPGFYKYRWGDGNIRTLSIYLFLKEDQILHFRDIPYRHNCHYPVLGSESVKFYPKGSLEDPTFDEQAQFLKQENSVL